jgi:putative DNA primase/helicase
MSYEFINFMKAAGFNPPEQVPAGRFIRFGKRYSDWCKLSNDGLCGFFGNWKTDEKYVWQSNDTSKISQQELAAIRTAAAIAMEKELAERKEVYKVASGQANAIWDKASKASPDHPYLINKGIGAHNIRQFGKNLLIPVCDFNGKIYSLQSIAPDGFKKFMPGGQVSGRCYWIGNAPGAVGIGICEGYATAATLYEHFGVSLIIVAFNAGNLLPVANAARKAFPTEPITIYGDDDWMTNGNPGKAKADAAAKAVGGKAVFPKFETNRQAGDTDFNDYFNSIKK